MLIHHEKMSEYVSNDGVVVCVFVFFQRYLYSIVVKEVKW